MNFVKKFKGLKTDGCGAKVQISQGSETFARLAGGGPDRLSFVGGRAALILAVLPIDDTPNAAIFCGNICDFGLRAALVFIQKV